MGFPSNSLRAVRGRVRGAWRRFAPRAVVLMYHRIAQLACDPWDLAVTPQHFAEHLQVLRRQARVVPLESLIQAKLTRWPDRAVAITFDDGYADNLLSARPLLEKYEVPATFFLSTGALGAGREFWWDELERLFLQPGVLPEQLELKLGHEHRKWSLGEEAEYSFDSWEQHRQWRAQHAPNTRRQRVYYEVWELLRGLMNEPREQALNELACWAGSTRDARNSHRQLTMAEAALLGKGVGFTLGGHTRCHVALSVQSRSDQQQEIEADKKVVESLANRAAVSFAYPYGDYSGETVELVRELGFELAVTTRGTRVEQGANPWRLPRFVVPDCDGEAFSRRLIKMFEPK